MDIHQINLDSNGVSVIFVDNSSQCGERQDLSEDLVTGCQKMVYLKFLVSYFSMETTKYFDYKHIHIFIYWDMA